MSDDQNEHVANLHRALGVPQSSPPEAPKVVDIKTRGPHQPKGSLGADLNIINEAFKKPEPEDG
jgi:hypothetical protein